MNRSTIFNTLILLPVIWLFSGLLVVGDGDKPMVALVVISAITSMYYYGIQTVKENLRHNQFLWVVLALTIYGLFSHYYYGISSREIRALLMSSVFITCFPQHLTSQRLLARLALMGSFACFFTAAYYGQYLDIDRGAWPINAIPLATISAAIGLLALAIASDKNTCNKNIAIIAFFISTATVLISQTRGVWIGYFLSIAVMIIAHFRHLLINKRSCLIALATLIVSGFTLKPVVEARIVETQYEIKQIISGNLDTSVGLRLQMWSLTPRLIENNWVIGLGRYHHERFDELYQQGEIPHSLKDLNPAHYHNQYLDRLVKNGVIGMALLIFLLITPLFKISSYCHEVRYALGAIVLLYASASLTDVPFNHPQTLLSYIFLVSCLTTISRKH